MQRKLIDILVETAEASGEYEVRAYEGYSGRGMYGDTTDGIVVASMNEFITLLYCSAKEITLAIEAGELDDVPESAFRSDNLGRDMIVY